MWRSIGKIAVTSVAVVVLFAGWSNAQAPQSAPNALVIERGTLIDGTGAPPRPVQALVIVGNRIKEIVPPGGNAQIPPGASRIRAEGLTLVPGLIDSHVHSRGFDAELYLSHGVTSVLDVSNIEDWILVQREGVAKGKIFGPRLFIAGAAINAAGLFSWHVPVKDPESAMQATRKLAAKGVDMIKVHSGITPVQLQAITREAHRAGLNVIGHLGVTDAREAAEAGIDALAHTGGIALALAPKSLADKIKAMGTTEQNSLMLEMDFDVEEAKVDALAKLLVEKHVRIEPDLVLRAKGVSRQWPQFSFEIHELLKNPELGYIWPSARERWLFLTPVNDHSRGEDTDYLRLMSREEQAKRLAGAKRSFEFHASFLKKFVAAGGEIIAGTDAQHFGTPGLSYHQELQLLVEEAGMTPMQALVSATRNPARFIHKEKDLGTLEPGKLADLLLVRGNPAEDIKNIHNIEKVIQDGKIVETGYHRWYKNPIPRPSTETGGTNPVPIMTSLSPNMATEGDSEVTLTIKGSRFVPGCAVTFNGQAVPLVAGNQNQLTVKLQKTDLMTVGTFPVVVTNPTPEGGPSQPVYFMVKFR